MASQKIESLEARRLRVIADWAQKEADALEEVGKKRGDRELLAAASARRREAREYERAARSATGGEEFMHGMGFSGELPDA